VVLCVSLASVNEAADLTASRPAERLAGRSSGDEVDLGPSEESHKVGSGDLVPEVDVHCQPWKVRPMSVQRLAVMVHGGGDGPPCVGEALAQPAGPGEQVDSEPLSRSQPLFAPLRE
jgi:hypothetical protein